MWFGLLKLLPVVFTLMTVPNKVISDDYRVWQPKNTAVCLQHYQCGTLGTTVVFFPTDRSKNNRFFGEITIRWEASYLLFNLKWITLKLWFWWKWWGPVLLDCWNINGWIVQFIVGVTIQKPIGLDIKKTVSYLFCFVLQMSFTIYRYTVHCGNTRIFYEILQFRPCLYHMYVVELQ